jgi:hypothetical protein
MVGVGVMVGVRLGVGVSVIVGVWVAVGVGVSVGAGVSVGEGDGDLVEMLVGSARERGCPPQADRSIKKREIKANFAFIAYMVSGFGV